MYNIICRNVNHALLEIYELIMSEGQESESRNGPVAELNAPLMVTLQNPIERCLFWPRRKWNPFFAFHEAMWIMAGRRDVEWLCNYNANMVTWSDNGRDFNAPYGHRMRNHDMENMNSYDSMYYQAYGDQIKEIINLLKSKPDTRQAVIQIWDYRFDGPFKRTLDRACNMLVIFSLRNKELRMSVINRSNDLLLGFCNVNHIQFSILQEYVAKNIGAKIGPYTHFSNCMHIYLEDPRLDKLKEYYVNDIYSECLKITPLIYRRAMWDRELKDFMRKGGNTYYSEPWFETVMAPLDRAWWLHKERKYGKAFEETNKISSLDIKRTAQDWLRETERIWRNNI